MKFISIAFGNVKKSVKNLEQKSGHGYCHFHQDGGNCSIKWYRRNSLYLRHSEATPTTGSGFQLIRKANKGSIVKVSLVVELNSFGK